MDLYIIFREKYICNINVMNKNIFIAKIIMKYDVVLGKNCFSTKKKEILCVRQNPRESMWIWKGKNAFMREWLFDSE